MMKNLSGMRFLNCWMGGGQPVKERSTSVSCTGRRVDGEVLLVEGRTSPVDCAGMNGWTGFLTDGAPFGRRWRKLDEMTLSRLYLVTEDYLDHEVTKYPSCWSGTCGSVAPERLGVCVLLARFSEFGKQILHHISTIQTEITKVRMMPPILFVKVLQYKELAYAQFGDK